MARPLTDSLMAAHRGLGAHQWEGLRLRERTWEGHSWWRELNRQGPGGRKVSRAGRGVSLGQGLDRSDDAPVTISQVGSLFLWRGLARLFSSTQHVLLGTYSEWYPSCWAQVFVKGRTRWVPDSRQPRLPSRHMSQTLESLRRSSGLGEPRGSKPAMGEDLLVLPLMLPLLPSRVP